MADLPTNLTFFLLHCGGAAALGNNCDEMLEVPWGVLASQDALHGWLKRKKWISAVASPPGLGRVVIDPLCRACAVASMGEELVSASEKGLLPQ